MVVHVYTANNNFVHSPQIQTTPPGGRWANRYYYHILKWASSSMCLCQQVAKHLQRATERVCIRLGLAAQLLQYNNCAVFGGVKVKVPFDLFLRLTD